MENKTQNSFVLLCPGTFLNGVCVVCVLYIFFQSGTDESLGSHTYHGQITPNLPRKFQTGLESASQNITLNNAVIDDTRSESAYSISADSSVSQSPNYQAYPDHFQQSSLNSIYQAWFHLLRQTKDLAHEHERIKQHAYISCMGNVPQMNDSTAIVVKRAKELFK